MDVAERAVDYSLPGVYWCVNPRCSRRAAGAAGFDDPALIVSVGSPSAGRDVVGPFMRTPAVFPSNSCVLVSFRWLLLLLLSLLHAPPLLLFFSGEGERRSRTEHTRLGLPKEIKGYTTTKAVVVRASWVKSAAGFSHLSRLSVKWIPPQLARVCVCLLEGFPGPSYTSGACVYM